ncbi:putative tyrosine-protein phosphatase OCA1 (putative) [Pseudozyma hubeiensis]|nr:putative tyrosine-protein phosphatase OCA1 (putative) [Pseudozyma hubeiensis]
MASSHLAPPTTSSSSSRLGTSPSSSSTAMQHSLTSASTASSSSHSHSHSHHHHHHHSTPIPTASVVEPPALFASVAPIIYRSATPTPSNHSFLRTLQLRTILSLTAELPSPSLVAFCQRHNIQFLHFGLRRWGSASLTSSSSSSPPASPMLDLSFLHTSTLTTTSSSPTLTEDLVKDSLQLLLTSSHHPILVTDTSGIHEIGVLLGCLRKLQRWNFATILLEYRHFAGNRARATNERFVEMFDTDLITVDREAAPRWFREAMERDDAELEEM